MDQYNLPPYANSTEDPWLPGFEFADFAAEISPFGEPTEETGNVNFTHYCANGTEVTTFTEDITAVSEQEVSQHTSSLLLDPQRERNTFDSRQCHSLPRRRSKYLL